MHPNMYQTHGHPGHPYHLDAPVYGHRGSDLQGIGQPHLDVSIPRSAQQNSLDSRYVVQHPSYFQVGTVLAILWAEPAGNEVRNSSIASQQTVFTGMFNEPMFNNIRRMVVCKVKGRRSLCHPITTYGGRGVAKPGVDPALHAAVFTGGSPPPTNPMEPRMTKRPLKVLPKTPAEQLDPKSLLDFGRIHTVEHNFRVRPIGQIAPEYMHFFRANVDQAFNG